jgi:hypothetical protein
LGRTIAAILQIFRRDFGLNSQARKGVHDTTSNLEAGTKGGSGATRSSERTGVFRIGPQIVRTRWRDIAQYTETASGSTSESLSSGARKPKVGGHKFVGWPAGRRILAS